MQNGSPLQLTIRPTKFENAPLSSVTSFSKLPESWNTCCWKCHKPLHVGARYGSGLGLPVDTRCPRCPLHGVYCVPLACDFWRRNVRWQLAGSFCTLGCMADASADASFLLRMFAMDVCSRKPPLRLFLRFVFGKTGARRPDLWRRLRKLPSTVKPTRTTTTTTITNMSAGSSLKRKESRHQQQQQLNQMPSSIKRLAADKLLVGTASSRFFERVGDRMARNAKRIKSHLLRRV